MDLINGIQGDDRYILDFLFEEVFSRQTEETQHFLLHTCLLDRFTASLCDTVGLTTNSQSVLEAVYRANLFISPLDDGKEWFHYHPLFANLLNRELIRREPHSIPELHRRASAWYEEHGYLEQAINHSLLIADHDRVVHLLKKDFFSGYQLIVMG